ncbi:TPA: MFS transporter [Burkholderia vietnamiensis]|nr:MFS transporter [Burkholderia vietnamiensis]HDR8979359.1 MFS transporter [Burkholderia vietnamiensis]
MRVVTAWHPAKERALAIGMYTAMQYVALGVLVAAIWHALYRDPQHSNASRAELDFIKAGGGLADSTGDVQHDQPTVPTWTKVKQLLSHRQRWGMFIGQLSVNTTLFFFLTGFPTYLINGKGMTMLKGGIYAAIPFLVAIFGTLIAGRLSDWMVGAGFTNSKARKVPIIIGFTLSCVILGANYTSSINVVIAFMAVAFFGQAMASTVTGALLSDIAPNGMVGLLYFVANVGGTLAPIVVGFIVKSTGGFNLALVYVAAVAALGVASYLFVLGDVRRIEIASR